MQTIEWILLIWLAALGGCIGSFLNVVVYRLPAGKSLLRPGSRCPRCDKPIRPYHNIPVLGWLALRGRCRDCGAKISPRYPLVELVTALFFVAVAGIVFYVGGATAPATLADGRRWLLYVSLVVLGSTLFCEALILYDKSRVPRVLIVVALVSAVISATMAWLVTVQ